MKNYSFLLLLLLGIATSCVDTYQWTDQIAALPSWSLEKGTASYSKVVTMKIGLKGITQDNVSKKSFTLYNNSDQKEAVKLKISWTGGGTLRVNNKAISSGDEISSEGLMEIPFLFTPLFNESKQYVISIVSVNGAASSEETTVYTLNTYQNKPPTASFVLTKQSQFIYVLDATASADGDVADGGSVVRYTYTVSGSGRSKTFDSTDKQTTYEFPAVGNYEISLIVTDNDNIQSSVANQTVSIN